MKKKTLVPLIVFLLGICLVSLIVYKTDTHEKEQRHITAQLNVVTYGERIKNEITAGIEITDALKQILISEDGDIYHFETIAGNLISDSIESIQLAPNGVVTDIYPAAGNEAGKIDLIHDKDRGKISCYARDNHTIITQGPFKLKQGGYGIAVRNPVYLKDKSGQEYFWGFAIVILRVPDIFSDTVSALSNFGYEYKILKTDIPWSDTYKVVYQSDGQIDHPISYAFTVGDGTWKLEVTPKTGWRNNTLLIIISGKVGAAVHRDQIGQGGAPHIFAGLCPAVGNGKVAGAGGGVIVKKKIVQDLVHKGREPGIVLLVGGAPVTAQHRFGQTALTPGRINGEPCTALQGSMIPAVERIGVGGNSLCLECFVRPADRHFGGDSPQNVFPAGKLHYLSGGLILHRKGLGVCGRKVFWLRCGQLRHRRCCGQRRCMAQHSPRDPVGGQRQSTAQNQQDCKDQQK